MGRLIKNHWARLIIMVAAVGKSLPSCSHHFPPNYTSFYIEIKRSKTNKRIPQVKLLPPSMASCGPKSFGTSSPTIWTRQSNRYQSFRASTWSWACYYSALSGRLHSSPAPEYTARSSSASSSSPLPPSPPLCNTKAPTPPCTTSSEWPSTFGPIARAK